MTTDEWQGPGPKDEMQIDMTKYYALMPPHHRSTFRVIRYLRGSIGFRTRVSVFDFNFQNFHSAWTGHESSPSLGVLT